MGAGKGLSSATDKKKKRQAWEVTEDAYDPGGGDAGSGTFFGGQTFGGNNDQDWLNQKKTWPDRKTLEDTSGDGMDEGGTDPDGIGPGPDLDFGGLFDESLQNAGEEGYDDPSGNGSYGLSEDELVKAKEYAQYLYDQGVKGDDFHAGKSRYNLAVMAALGELWDQDDTDATTDENIQAGGTNFKADEWLGDNWEGYYDEKTGKWYKREWTLNDEGVGVGGEWEEWTDNPFGDDPTESGIFESDDDDNLTTLPEYLNADPEAVPDYLPVGDDVPDDIKDAFNQVWELSNRPTKEQLEKWVERRGTDSEEISPDDPRWWWGYLAYYSGVSDHIARPYTETENQDYLDLLAKLSMWS